MKGVAWIPLAALAATCCGQADTSSERASQHPPEGLVLARADDLPAMPAYPNAIRGHLVTVSAGDYDINADWQASAGLCGEIGMLEMYAGPPGRNAALLIRIPGDHPLGSYPIVPPDANFPAAPAALIGVQVFGESEAFGFQAYHGVLELTELGERVSGRFESTLREVGMDMLTHFVGVFESIPVEPLPDDYCRVVRDSTLRYAPPADSSLGGS